jgi:C4-dicarboxylate-specific signal transduction histidine kinase
LQIADGLQRSIDIIQDLQSFSDTSVAITTQQDISKTIHSVLRLLKSMTREVRVFVDVKKFFVQVNHGLLQQTLYNLVKNSCEALAMKGTVKIYSTETVEHYQLIIEDDGPGLPEIVKANLFSPFMSTRESQGGTGLGLYIAYESCKKMNIDFQFDDGFKNGTRFQLVFKK